MKKNWISLNDSYSLEVTKFDIDLKNQWSHWNNYNSSKNFYLKNIITDSFIVCTMFSLYFVQNFPLTSSGFSCILEKCVFYYPSLNFKYIVSNNMNNFSLINVSLKIINLGKAENLN